MSEMRPKIVAVAALRCLFSGDAVVVVADVIAFVSITIVQFNCE